MDKYERIAWDVLDELKRESPEYFNDNEYKEEDEEGDLDNLMILAIMGGILAGLDTAEVLAKEYEEDHGTIVKQVVESLKQSSQIILCPLAQPPGDSRERGLGGKPG